MRLSLLLLLLAGPAAASVELKPLHVRFAAPEGWTLNAGRAEKGWASACSCTAWPTSPNGAKTRPSSRG